MRWTFVVSDVLCLLLLQVLIEMTNGGVDRSVECTGNVNAMISAFECVHDVCS
jgi:Zn-dependent alcohol dehydrogenase